jgi:putative ABC transport system permease protein
MFKNYIKLAIRNLWKNKVVTVTNLLGLTLGISCSLLLLLYVKYEYSFDEFIPEKNNTYFLYGEQTGANERKVGLSGEWDYLDLQKNYSGIEAVAKVRNSTYDFFPEGNAEKKVKVHIQFVSSNFFSFFGFPLLEGKAENVLTDPSSVVLTESTAKALFGDEDAMGKTVTMAGSSFTKDLIVRGIAKDVKTSHIQFKAIIPWEMTLSDGTQIAKGYDYSLYTYIKTASGVNVDQISQLKNEKLKEDPDFNNDFSYGFVPVSDMYLGTGDIQFMSFLSGNAASIKTLFFIAIIILLVACINYINLQTAKGAKRSMEVGVRKVMGAHRAQLVWQFLGEAIIITFLAALFAVLLIDLGLPSFNQLTGKDFTTSALVEAGLIPFLIVITLFTALFSGIYPALVLSSFHPSQALRAATRGALKGASARKSLMFIQFVISIFLVAVTAIAYRQNQFIHTKDLGFNKDQVITFGVQTKNLRNSYRAFKNEIEKYPGVVASSIGTDVLGDGYTNNSGPMLSKSNPDLSAVTTIFGVDFDFIKTYDLQIVQGRDFDIKSASDSGALIVNEAFVNQLGLENPLEDEVALYNINNEGMPIIGIVKDFHFQKLHQKINPVALRIGKRNFWSMSVQIKAENREETLAFLAAKWAEFEPDQPFSYEFVDDSFARFYENETRLLKATSFFSVVSIVLTALGLFGMVTFVIERKVKEIGIRKVLGASSSNISYIILKEFLLVLGIAAIVAVPLVLGAGREWLADFAYRIDIGLVPFALALALSLIVVLLTVSLQAVKAAHSNPVDALKSE